MAIKWTRIDDRLIHGQVASSWLSYVGAEQIICISDTAANNPVQAQVLKMAAPNNIVHIFGVDKFIKIYNAQPIKKSTFLILQSTADVLKLVENGVDLDYINFGGMRARADRNISFDHDLCFTQEELDAVDKLIDRGVKIEYQIAAYDSPTDLKKKLGSAK